MSKYSVITIAALLLLVLFGYSARGAKTIETQEIMVFAAASLTESLGEIVKGFETHNPGGVKIVFNFAGSQTLRTQIEEGLHADIFISANDEYAEELKNGGFIDNYTLLVRNKLAVVRNRKSCYTVKRINDLAAEGIKIAVADKSVPAGKYWEKALDKALKEKNINNDEKDKIQSNIVTKEFSVKDVVSKVLLNEVDVGVVYVTDFTEANNSRLEMINFPVFEDFPASYPVALLKGSKEDVNVRNFCEFIFSKESREVFRRYGFIIPE